ncbi:MAG: hypothetical protein JWP08_237 [Bryobacterales bacterium]|nr:hypothetical protein [Bryobacterales bacterium]
MHGGESGYASHLVWSGPRGRDTFDEQTEVLIGRLAPLTVGHGIGHGPWKLR